VRAVEAVRSVWPNAYVTAATEILPEIREFERLSTATLNAYLQPVVSSYLDRLETGLEAKGFGGDILIVQSNGGVMSIDMAKRYPVGPRSPVRRPASSPPRRLPRPRASTTSSPATWAAPRSTCRWSQTMKRHLRPRPRSISAWSCAHR
jgi:hypothetical protein